MQLYTKILIGMLVGILAGFLVGPNSTLLPQTGVHISGGTQIFTSEDGAEVSLLGAGLRDADLTGETSGDLVQISWGLSSSDILRLQASGTSEQLDSAIAEFEARGESSVQGWVRDVEPEVRRFAPMGAKLVASTVWVGKLFLALIKMVVIPLVFCSLVVGVASLGDFSKLGRMGGRTLGVFTLTTIVALTIGVTLANVINPGRLVAEEDKAALLANYSDGASSVVGSAAEAPTLTEQLIGIVPQNPISALANGDMLQIIFFALMLGIALTMLQMARSKPVIELLDGINEAMVMLVHLVMKLAPFGVATLLFEVVGSTGVSVLVALGAYALVVMSGLLLHLAITYGTIIRVGAKLPFVQFLSAIKPALLVGFSTSSSSATLPVTMECCEDRLNVSPGVSSFVLPLGATVNMDGTALYQGVAAIFIAQVYGLDLTMADQATIVGTATLASVGAAGVPGAGMITLAMVLTAIGVPAEGLALVLGVDRILDMFRTATNIVGDSAVTALMSRLEGDDLKLMSDAQDRADSKKGVESRGEEAAKQVIAPATEAESAE
jgi:proton glutamate symport protein